MPQISDEMHRIHMFDARRVHYRLGWSYQGVLAGIGTTRAPRRARFMAQWKRDERPAPSEQVRLDEDGYELPGPHADVLFALQAASDVRRRRGFWTKLVGRGPVGAEVVERRIVRPTAPSEPEAGTATL
jgi:hypothetical protein